MVNPAVANSALREFSFLNALAFEETSVLRVVVETTRRVATRNAEEEIIVGRSVKPAIVAVGVFLALPKYLRNNIACERRPSPWNLSRYVFRRAVDVRAYLDPTVTFCNRT